MGLSVIGRDGELAAAERFLDGMSAGLGALVPPVATLRRELPAGRASIGFDGRVRGTALRPGRYRARLLAADAAGNRSSTATVRFTVVAG